MGDGIATELEKSGKKIYRVPYGGSNEIQKNIIAKHVLGL